QSIRELSEPLLAGAGLQLWDVEVGKGVVRILVDREGGVDLDALTRASHTLSGLFDDHPEVAPPGAYQLEVSSPGVERTLRTVEQYRRYIGELVSIKLTAALEGQRRWRGTLVSADAEGVQITPEDRSTPVPGNAAGGYEDTVSLRYDQIERARTVLVWGPSTGQRQAKGHKKNANGGARWSDPRQKGRTGLGAGSGAEVKETS
ncbi:MAG: ribosome maturation factor RimP, partial [Acidimicrobiaceae bacterium]|nr:ribosome maturation factor RimP [Acidimicrobiaceae bacterium]